MVSPKICLSKNIFSRSFLCGLRFPPSKPLLEIGQNLRGVVLKR
jgi:hypothetical protein